MGFGSALRHRGFASLWLSQLVSRLGDSIHEIALIWLVYEVTGDPTLLALTVAASALPTAASSLPAGSLVDVLNRRQVLVAASLLRGGLVLLIPLTGPGPLLVPVVLGVAAATGVIEAFAGPARGALIPNLVPREDLDPANALFELTRSASRMLYVLGGIAVALLGSFAVFYLDAVSFLVAAALLFGVPAGAGVARPDDRPSEGSWFERMASDVRAGLAFVRSHRYLPSVILLSLLTTLAMAPLAVVLPFFVRATTGGGSTAFGLLYGAIYVGVIAGAIGIGVFDRLTAAYRGWIIVGGVALVGIALVATAVLPPRSANPLTVAFASLVGLGVAFTLVNTPVQTLVQSTVPDEKRGRVFAVLAAITLPALPVGALAAGPLVERFSAPSILLAQGIVLVVVSLPLLLTPLAKAGQTNRNPGGGEATEAPDVR